MLKHRIFFVAILAVIGLVVVLLAGRVQEKEQERLRNLEGYSVFLKKYEPRRAAPSFTLPTLDGDTVSLDELRGRVVMISFRTTW